MRVLLLTQFYRPVMGGEERHVESLAHALARRGHVVCVTTQRAASVPDRENDGPVHIRRLPSSMMRLSRFGRTERPHAPPFPDPEFTRGLLEVARDFQPDLIHAHNWALNSWLPVRALVRAPLVLTLHDYGMRCGTQRLMYRGAPCAGPAVRRCLECTGTHYGTMVGPAIAATNAAMAPLRARAIDHAICVSTAVAEGNRLESLRIPFSVIPNFAPTEGPPRQESMLPLALDGPPFILFVGDISVEKGVPDLIAAYSAMADPPPLVMLGRKVDPFPPMPRGITVLPPLPHEAVMAAFRSCLFAVAPSRWPDPCPTVVWEAMATGKAVITTSLGGMLDQIEDGVTGFLVPPGDVAALRSSMEALTKDAAMRTTVGAAARDRARSVDVEAGTTRVETVYRSVARSGSATTEAGAGAIRPIRVLYLIDSLRGGGAERSLVDIVKPLRTRGVSVVTATLLPDDGALTAELARYGMDVRRLAARAPWVAARDLRRLIREVEPDLVHTTLMRADLLGRLVGAAVGIPVVTSLVNDSYCAAHRKTSRYGSWGVSALWALDRATARLPVRYHAISNPIGQSMAARLGIPGDRIDVIARGRDAEKLGKRSAVRRANARALLGLADDVPVILVVAREAPQKGVDVAVLAIRQIRRTLPNAVLAVAGGRGDATATLDEMLRSEPHGVLRLGHRDDVPELMCAADALALPSRWEGLAGTLIEAMALELPVVASDLPAVEEALGGCACALVPVDDNRALADALLHVLSGGPEVAAKVAAGRTRFLASLGSDAAAERMRAFYDRALVPGPTPQRR